MSGIAPNAKNCHQPVPCVGEHEHGDREQRRRERSVGELLAATRVVMRGMHRAISLTLANTVSQL